MNQKLLERYFKVKALADAGAPGERDAARSILRDLEVKNPGLREAAEAHVRAETLRNAPDPFPSAWPPNYGQGTANSSSTRAGPVPRSGPGTASDPRKATGNWEKIFQYAQGMYNTYEAVKDVVEDVAQAYYGKVLAEEVEISAGTRDRSIFIRLKVPFEIVTEARELNDLQKETFRQHLHDELDTYIDAILAKQK